MSKKQNTSALSRIVSPIIFELSMRNLRLNFLRSMLSMIGIIIGVLAITSLGMMGAAFSTDMTSLLSSSTNSLTIMSVEEKTVDGIPATGLSSKDMRDIEAAIRSATSDYSLIPMYQGTKVAKFQNKEFGAQTYGLRPGDIPELVTIQSGKVPRGSEGVLIGEKLADDHDLRIGSRLTMTDKNGATTAVRVVGILENSGMSLTFSTDSAIVGTTTWYESIVNTHNLYISAMVKTGNLDNLDAISSAIEKRMNGRADRDTDDRVYVMDARQFAAMMQEGLGMISLFLVAIGGISLLVAAVAIFNVMLMSVNERIREIGILRSIGTLRNQVLLMFLYEAAIIGLIGAVIGGVLSVGASAVVIGLLFGNISLMFAPSVLIYIPYGIVIGILVCLLSGLYPAWKAANLNPVEALASD
ncbi:MAG: ABC transporter permease [Methanocorpusculum sp.]|nr:ABC transporter permease [Methanocorpusculum sp.]